MDSRNKNPNTVHARLTNKYRQPESSFCWPGGCCALEGQEYQPTAQQKEDRHEKTVIGKDKKIIKR